MDFYWVYEIGTWQLGALIISLTVLLALGGLRLTRSWILHTFRLSDETNEGVNGFFSGVGVFYGLLLGLVAVATWESYDGACDLASKEASEFAALYRDVGFFPSPEKCAMQDYLYQYLDYVVHVEWPAHRHGMRPVGGGQLLNGLQKILTGFHPPSIEQQTLQAEALRTFNQLIEARRLRMDAVNNGLPPILWFVVIFGATLSIAVTYFLHFDEAKTHFVLVAFIAIFIGMMIFFIASTDNPFRGPTSVSSDSYSEILENVWDLDIDIDGCS
jgi:hypothetical protein